MDANINDIMPPSGTQTRWLSCDINCGSGGVFIAIRVGGYLIAQCM